MIMKVFVINQKKAASNHKLFGNVKSFINTMSAPRSWRTVFWLSLFCAEADVANIRMNQSIISIVQLQTGMKPYS